MAQALATLPPTAREAIVLFELEGFTLDEFAAMQDDSIPAVKSRLSRARRRLRDFYEKLDGARPQLSRQGATSWKWMTASTPTACLRARHRARAPPFDAIAASLRAAAAAARGVRAPPLVAGALTLALVLVRRCRTRASAASTCPSTPMAG